MKTNASKRRGFTLVELLVVIVIIAALAGLTAPMVIRQRKKADQTEAVNNARQVGFALFEFETAYDSFPDSTTAQTVTDNTGTQLSLSGTTSNDYFKQLIAAEIAPSESMFYAKTSFSKKPDNIFTTDAKALAPGEVGFGYIMNTDTAFSTAGNPARPIIAAPLMYPFATGQFDSDFYDSKAVVLRIDNSVQSFQIRKSDNKVSLGGANTLLDATEDSVWGTGPNPTMVNPQPKK